MITKAFIMNAFSFWHLGDDYRFSCIFSSFLYRIWLSNGVSKFSLAKVMED